MNEYQTSKYLDITLNNRLAANFWGTEGTHPEEFADFLEFLNDRGDAGYLEWLETWRDELSTYMDGEKGRQEILKNHPENHVFFLYAEWRHLQDGALLNTLLSRYGYAEFCSGRDAYLRSGEFLQVLLGELEQLSIYPPPISALQKEALLMSRLMGRD